MKRILLLLLVFISVLASGQVTLTSSNLPVIVINTNGGINVPDTPKILATMRIINHAPGTRNYVTDPGNEYSGNIGIELRGQSSLSFPQKPYSIELRDSTGINSKNQSLFGLPAESDWILYPPYTDKTLMRNFLAFQMSMGMGHWASHSRFTELVLNGEYLGIYVLEEKIKRDSGRVNIKKLKTADSSGNALTGGYIFSIDKDANAWYSPYNTPVSNNYIHFSYVYPKIENIIPQQSAYLQSYVDSFENALASFAFQNTAIGFRKYADENSFIDYFIVNEVSRNVDGYRLSAYFHKNRNDINGKIIAGPVWDYNLGFRNADYCDGSNYQSWAYQFNSVCPTDPFQIPFWWSRLMQDTAFKSHLSCRWKQLRTGLLSIQNINHQIDSIAALVNEAQVRHYTKWPILGQYVWPNPSPIPTTYQGEIIALKSWIANRIAWLDINMPQTTYCPATLPIALLDFSVAKSNNNALLLWHTASENNSDHFALERSKDGKHFSTIAKVKAAGNSYQKRTYQYTDEAITKLESNTIFYRLQSVDKDGTSKASNIILLNLANPSFEIQTFPNPVSDNLGLSVTSQKMQSAQVSIMNEEGRKIITDNRNINVGSNQFYYNTALWSKGVYLIKVILQDGDSRLLRVVK